MRPGDFGLTLEPSRSYAYVYPLPQESLIRLAYSFEDSSRRKHVHRGVHDQPGRQRLQEVVLEWNDLWRSARPVLQVRDDGHRLHLFDTRPSVRRRNWTSNECEAAVYRACDSAQTSSGLLSQLSQRHVNQASRDEIDSAIAALCDAKVLLRLNGKLLSLGVNAAVIS
jgi:hypothetical protein